MFPVYPGSGTVNLLLQWFIKSNAISASPNLQSTLFRKIRTCLRVSMGRGQKLSIVDLGFGISDFNKENVLF